jgi:uncharacterized UPF0160 family protein
MSWLINKKKVAVHDGHFHADDVFAVAILAIYLNNNIKIFRTRDSSIYEKMDYLLDVGREYDPIKNKFDHHQEGSLKRDNNIPYASAGLVWKEFGEKISGSKEVFDLIDKTIIQDIDAADNGFDSHGENANGVQSYLFEDYVLSLNSTWTENDKNQDKNFIQAVSVVKDMLCREIKQAQDYFEAKDKIMAIYNKTENKKIIILDDNYPWTKVFDDLVEPFFVIRPVRGGQAWNVSCVKVKGKKFVNRASLPKDWAGKIDADLANITGVSDALFCHKELFICSARSKEGAIKLAELALQEAEKNK